MLRYGLTIFDERLSLVHNWSFSRGGPIYSRRDEGSVMSFVKSIMNPYDRARNRVAMSPPCAAGRRWPIDSGRGESIDIASLNAVDSSVNLFLPERRQVTIHIIPVETITPYFAPRSRHIGLRQIYATSVHRTSIEASTPFGPGNYTQYTMEIDDVFKAPSGLVFEETLMFKTPDDSSACRLDLDIGVEFVVGMSYMYGSEEYGFYTNACGPTQSMDSLTDDQLQEIEYCANQCSTLCPPPKVRSFPP